MVDTGKDQASAIASVIREIAYASAKLVATDDEFWRKQLDYLESELRRLLETPLP